MARQEISRLPHSRKEQIGYLIKYDTSSIFAYGLLAFLFLLPLLASYFALILLTSSMSATGATSGELFNLYFIFGLINIACVFIFGIGNMGIYNNMRELTLLSSSYVSSFFKGIAKNFKSFYKYYLLLSILVGLLTINLGATMYFKEQHTLELVALVINIVLLTLTLFIKPYVMFEASLFDNGLLAYLRNGFYFFTKGFKVSILNFLLYIAPYLALILLPINFFFIPIALLAVGYISLYSVVNYVSNLDLFEKFVPEDQIKSIFHVGLEDSNSN